jgi:hypothetical protein
MTRVSESRRDESPTLRCESQDWYTDCKPSRLKAECTHLKGLLSSFRIFDEEKRHPRDRRPNFLCFFKERKLFYYGNVYVEINTTESLA